MKWVIEKPASNLSRPDLSWYWTGYSWSHHINQALRFNSSDEALGAIKAMGFGEWQACALQAER